MCGKNVLNIIVWLCTVTLLLALSSKSQVIGRNGQIVDCRIYVYAPVCRGVAAKRAFDSSRILLHKMRTEEMPGNYLENYPPRHPLGRKK